MPERPRPAAGTPHLVKAGSASRPKVKTKPRSRVKTSKQMPDRPIPTMGWPAVWYKVLCLFGQRHRVPEMNDKESKILIRAESIAELRDLTNQVPTLSFAFWNTKGGAAKTPTAVHTAATFAEYARVTTILVDGNQAAGTCAARFGLNYSDTVTTQEVARTIRKDEELAHRDFKTQISQARPSKEGVRVVSADSIIDEHRRLDGTAMGRVLELMNYNTEFMGIDTGNDIGDVVARAIAEHVDVFVFTANAGPNGKDSLRKLATSMQTLRNLGFAEKVDNSVVVISNVPQRAELDDYRMYLNEVSFTDQVTKQLESRFVGMFLAVPRDSFIAQDTIVDLERLEWETLQAYITLACAVLRQSPKLRSPLSDGTTPADELT